jgi:N6-L-threonylcarbamoyladenine synthase
MNLLAIETSCDETSVAILEAPRRLRANLVFTQIARHRPYGGVVPEIASRCHVEELPGLLRQALTEAGLGWRDLDAIAVTQGPGLASALLIGLAAAQALALRLDVPLLGVNHLEGHLYSLFLDESAPRFEDALPFITLIVSGGHTQLVRVEAPGRYLLLGQTLDDAAGEALDKGAKLLGLGYPGGPLIERAAQGGDVRRIKFPRGQPSAHAAGLDPDLCFSYSGLKTALLHHLKAHPAAAAAPELPHTAASYQEAVFAALCERSARAVARAGVKFFGCCGGVSINQRLRAKLAAMAERAGARLLLAPPRFCTDNAAMIAAAACRQLPRAPGAEKIPQLDAHPELTFGTFPALER